MPTSTDYPPTEAGSSKKRKLKTKPDVPGAQALAGMGGNTAGESELVWGAAAIGSVVNLSEKQAFYYMPRLVEAGAVQKFEGRYVGWRQRLLALMGGAA